MPSLAPVMEAYSRLYPASADWSKPFRRLAAVVAVRAGLDVAKAARQGGTTAKSLLTLLDGDPVQTMFGLSWEDAASHDKNRLARRGVGQMVLGVVAERVFEKLFNAAVEDGSLVLKDLRDARNDTDYHVLDAARRPVLRINIKAHGTLFQNAKDLVGLDPEDCFALATYKIYQGLKKEEEEGLPYVFMVASVPNLTGASVGASVPDEFGRLATLLRASKGVSGLGKRDVEERIVDFLLSADAPESFVPTRDAVANRFESADWRAISADKGNALLRDKLWDRVYAVKQRGFAQNYPNAELDMHFSLERDMTPFSECMRIHKEDGTHKLTSLFSRGVL